VLAGNLARGCRGTEGAVAAYRVQTPPLPLNQPCGEMPASAIGGPEAAVSRDLSEARIAAGLEPIHP
jgi:hypothetical protein